MTPISVISTSNAADLGYLALADVAASGLDPQKYRIVGGHMVQLLIHVYPTTEATERSTADADAGIDGATAVGQDLHRHLLGSGYEATSGNHYVKKEEGGGERAVDLLIPHGTVGEPEQVNGRGFDAIPGLGFALAATPVILEVPDLGERSSGYFLTAGNHPATQGQSLQVGFRQQLESGTRLT